jgi:hypothetical protein
MDLGQNWSNIISSNGTANVTSNQSVASNNPAATSPFGGSTEDDSAKNKYKQNILEGIINAQPNAKQA